MISQFNFKLPTEPVDNFVENIFIKTETPYFYRVFVKVFKLFTEIFSDCFSMTYAIYLKKRQLENFKYSVQIFSIVRLCTTLNMLPLAYHDSR